MSVSRLDARDGGGMFRQGCVHAVQHRSVIMRRADFVWRGRRCGRSSRGKHRLLSPHLAPLAATRRRSFGRTQAIRRNKLIYFATRSSYPILGGMIKRGTDSTWGAGCAPSRVSGVHGDEDPEAGLDDDVAAHERNTRVVALEGLLDGHDLLTHHGQHLKEHEHSEAAVQGVDGYTCLDKLCLLVPLTPDGGANVELLLLGEGSQFSTCGESRVPQC